MKKLYKMWAFRRKLHYEIKVRIFSASAALIFIIVFELVCLLSHLLHKMYWSAIRSPSENLDNCTLNSLSFSTDSLSSASHTSSNTITGCGMSSQCEVYGMLGSGKDTHFASAQWARADQEKTFFGTGAGSATFVANGKWTFSHSYINSHTNGTAVWSNLGFSVALRHAARPPTLQLVDDPLYPLTDSRPNELVTSQHIYDGMGQQSKQQTCLLESRWNIYCLLVAHYAET